MRQLTRAGATPELLFCKALLSVCSGCSYRMDRHSLVVIMLRLSVLALASLAFFTAGPASAMGKYVWSLIAIGPDP